MENNFFWGQTKIVHFLGSSHRKQVLLKICLMKQEANIYKLLRTVVKLGV